PTATLRLVAALLFGFALTGLVAYLVPSLHLGPNALGSALLVALTGSLVVRTAFFKWTHLGVFRSRVLVLGTGSRVMRIAEFAQRNPNHAIIGYVSMQPSRHYIPLPHVLPMEPGES